MGIFEVESPVDKLAEWDETLKATLTIQSLCLLISFTLFFIRTYQVIKETLNSEIRKSKIVKIRLLQVSHLCAMFFSAFYIFLHFWNYIHYYISTNPMECDAWFIIIMISITLSKNFVYCFLMLRSSLAFDTSLFMIPLPISIIVISIAWITQWIMTILMLTDFTPFSPFPTNGFCFRILGDNGTIGITGYNLVDALSAFIALILFWWKARFVSKGLNSLQADNELQPEMIVISEMFKKHILLGVLIFIGSILIWFGGEFLSVLMGIAGALHLTCNNVYIFLLFKPNDYIYQIVCCKKGFGKSNKDVDNLATQQKTNEYAVDSANTSNQPSTLEITNTSNVAGASGSVTIR
eukprot:383660_1